MNENENMLTTTTENKTNSGIWKKVLMGLGAAALGGLAAVGIGKAISKSKSDKALDCETEEVVNTEYEVVDF